MQGFTTQDRKNPLESSRPSLPPVPCAASPFKTESQTRHVTSEDDIEVPAGDLHDTSRDVALCESWLLSEDHASVLAAASCVGAAEWRMGSPGRRSAVGESLVTLGRLGNCCVTDRRLSCQRLSVSASGHSAGITCDPPVAASTAGRVRAVGVLAHQTS